MRILVATTSTYIAFHGQAIFTINLAEGLRRNGHEVLVVACSERSQAYSQQINGVQLEAIRTLDLTWIHRRACVPLFPSTCMQQILDDFHPDILHIQDHFPVCRAMVLAVRPGSLKLVGTNHFMPDNVAPFAPFLSWNKPWFDQASWSWMREVYDRLDAVAAPSRTAAEMLRKIGLRPPVSAISCGVDLHIFQPDPSVDRSAWRLRYGAGPNQKVFFFIGRVDPDKCLEVIIRAVALLDREDIQVMIAGEGAAKASLMAQVQRLGLERKVRFTGSIPNADLPSLLNSIDIFFMPGEAELLSIASLQAMGCARPMLVADAVALPELVTSGENGLLFHPGDIADAARCMAWLADHPERWPAMGASSLERVQPHSLENIVHGYEAFYRQVLNL